jgi:hypothetical protein
MLKEYYNVYLYDGKIYIYIFNRIGINKHDINKINIIYKPKIYYFIIVICMFYF